MFEGGWLTFHEDSLNVKTNPLANHGGSVFYAVEEWEPEAEVDGRRVNL